ncbi:MAG: type IVB secretion system protein IcmW [Pseudomonadota bacterium]
MPDLSPTGSHQYWYDFQDPMIYRVVTFLEGVEKWILDGNEKLEAKMKQLGDELDNIPNVDMSELGHENDFITISNAIGSSRVLRLLQAIDTAHPGSASKLLMYAEENSKSTDDPAGLFLRRNIVFERLRLLGRVFSEERLQMVLKAFEGEDYE